MKRIAHSRVVHTVLAIILSSLPRVAAGSEEAEVSIDLSSPGHKIDRRIFGQFIEHFGRVIQGGLWAELLRNRKFYPVDPDRTQVAQPWYPESDRSSVSYVIDRFESLDGVSSQRVSLFGSSASWRGIGQSGFSVLGGKEYTAYAWVKTDTPGERLAFRLESPDSKYEVQAEVVAKGEGWQRYEVRLKPSENLSPAVFRIMFNSPAVNWVGAASLMPSDNVAGIRKDLLDLVKAMAPTIIRWPGGGYPDEYDWRNGIGPRDRRPPQPILPFGQPYGYDNGIDPNDFGTDEFLHFCELIGAAPYITANFGSGTPELAASWVEYTNGPASSQWGARRAANGHSAPYDVKNWSVGNEIWGDPFEGGHTTAEGYSTLLIPIVRRMRESHPHIQVTAVGELGGLTGSDPSWNQTVVAKSGKDIDLLAIHHYYPAGFRPQSLKGKPLEFYYAVVADPWIFEHKLQEEFGKIDSASRTPGAIRVALDEWSEWDWDFEPPVDKPERSAVNQFIDLINQTGLEFNPTARDALFNARILQMLMRLSDHVPIAARTHMINSLGAIRTDSTRSFLTAAGVVMQLYSNHSGDTLVPVTQTSATFDVPEQGWEEVPYLDAVATSKEGRVFVHLINFHATENMDVHLRFTGRQVEPQGTVWRIDPPDFMSRNEFDVSNVVLTPEVHSVSGDMVVHMPPHSIETLEVNPK